MTPLPRSVRADRLAAAIGEGLPATLAQRLLDAPGLQPRLAALLSRRLGAAGGDAGLTRLLAMEAAAIDGLVLQAGVAWHGAAIVRMLDGSRIRALAARLGFDPRPLALGFASRPTPPGDATPEDQLPDRIASDGAACLAAWCAALPPPDHAHAQLVLPPHAAPGTAHAAYGPAVVAAVLDGMPGA